MYICIEEHNNIDDNWLGLIVWLFLLVIINLYFIIIYIYIYIMNNIQISFDTYAFLIAKIKFDTMKQIITNNKNQLQLTIISMDEAIDSANIKKIFIKYCILNFYLYFREKFYDIIKNINYNSSEETITSLSDEDIYYIGLGLPDIYKPTVEQKNYLIKFMNSLNNIIIINESEMKNKIKMWVPNKQARLDEIINPNKIDAFVPILLRINDWFSRDVYNILTLLNIGIIYNKYKVDGIKLSSGMAGGEIETLYNEYIKNNIKGKTCIEKEKTCDNSDINLYYIIGGLIFFIILIIIIFIIMYMKKNNNVEEIQNNNEEEIKNTRVKSKKNKRINNN